MPISNVVSRTSHTESTKGGDPSKVDKDGATATTTNFALIMRNCSQWLGEQKRSCEVLLRLEKADAEAIADGNIDWSAADLEEAITVAKRFGEPIPDSLGFSSWMHQDFPLCINDPAATWSSACIEEMNFEIKQMHKRKGKRDARAEASWLHGTAGHYKGLDCRACGGHLPEHTDLAGAMCECNALTIDTKDEDLPLVSYNSRMELALSDDEFDSRRTACMARSRPTSSRRRR